MRFGTRKNILPLIGGITAAMAVGGAAMYLLDPAAGRRRRAAMAHAANSAVHRAGGAVHSVGDAIHDAAISAGEKIGDAAARARRAGERAAHAAVELGHASGATAVGLRRLVDSYHDSAHYLAGRVDRLRQSLESPNRLSHSSHPSHSFHTLGSLAAGAKSALGHLAALRIKPAKRSLPFISLTIGGVACLAAGAGAMYYFDPDRGRDRRRRIRDGVVGTVSKVGRFARHRGKNVRRNVRAVAREVGLAPLAPPSPQQRISSQGYVSGEQLLLRVRSVIARTAGNPRTIQVMTDAAGAVTLTGDILDSERPRILQAVRETPGVRAVIDRLRVQSTPEAKATSAHTM